jgi:hypothetical protein
VLAVHALDVFKEDQLLAMVAVKDLHAAILATHCVECGSSSSNRKLRT